MGTKNIPMIVMLTAGLITSIVMYINHYDLSTTLKMVLLIFFVFYIIGCWLKKIWDRFCVPPQLEEEGNGEENEEGAQEQESEDGSVIEKK